jgi:RNA-directed DNA polymerase
MADASTSLSMSPGLLKVAERAKRDPGMRLLALAHHIDEVALERAYGQLRKDAAVGVDGVTVEQYSQQLAENVRVLHQRMKAGQYRHQPIRRVHIPKEGNKTRPIGISTVEDKVVQRALAEVLGAIYEQDFLDCSYGFRPRRSPHDALRTLNRELWSEAVNYVLEADIESFFDSIYRKMLMEMLRERIADESLLRLVGKCLHVGVLDGEEYSEPDVGTAQGSVLSPLLGNVFLHHVLDRWFEQEVKPRMKGRATLIRFADDFVILFERQDDAERVREAMARRIARFGLTLHPEKTRLFAFRPPQDGGNKGRETFDFLGFTLYWKQSRKGVWTVAFKTRRARLKRAIVAVAEWCRRHRHDSVKDQHAALTRKLQGHYAYYGVNGNYRSLRQLMRQVERSWHKWLERRGQRGDIPWERFKRILQALPLPAPRIKVQIWGN